MEAILHFPKGFLWGAAVSAYQVEGGINCDWTNFFPAGRACDHYHLYEKDFDLIEKLNLNAFRFSIEWSRIEPKEGKFDEKELEHYKKYLQALKAKKLKVMVTLHHFTNPLWLGKIGGWENKKVIFYFSRFAKKVFDEYEKLVDFWITLNEPLNYAFIGYLEGRWPPKKRNPFSFLKVIKNQILAHKKIYEIFHKQSHCKIGIAKCNNYFEPFNEKSFLDKFCCKICRYLWNEFFLERIKNYLDFIGLNFYHHNKIQFPFKTKNENKIVSDIGWEIYPQGIYYVLKELKKYNLPIYITENGVADKKDRLRKRFIKEHLCWIHKAIEKKVDVRGYFHWSLMDNFEWERGFEPRFGLIEINYKTMARKIRPSALFYGKIAKSNSLKCQS